jgi:hypothetical protein
MFKKFLIFLIINFSFSAFAEENKQVSAFAEENKQVEIWNSKKGLEMLNESQFKNDFYQLINFFQPQINPLYCSAATSTIILNALNYGNISSQKQAEVTKPEVMGGGVLEFHSYLQSGFFNEKTDRIKKREIINLKAPSKKIDGKEIYDEGLNLSDLLKILSQVYGLKTKVTYVEKMNEKSLNKFRQKLKEVLADDKNFMIVNFDGMLIGNKTRGHISPVAAYDEKTNSVLVLDVAIHKNPWYFVSVEKLFAAMNSKDGDSFRGYLIVGR